MRAQIRKYNHDVLKNIYSDLRTQSPDIDTLCHVLLEDCVLRAKKEVWHRLIPKESMPDDSCTKMRHVILHIIFIFRCNHYKFNEGLHQHLTWALRWII